MTSGRVPNARIHSARLLPGLADLLRHCRDPRWGTRTEQTSLQRAERPGGGWRSDDNGVHLHHGAALTPQGLHSKGTKQKLSPRHPA